MFKKIRAFYQREDINTGRQKNIDYAKVIAIIGMILIHVMLYPYYTKMDTGFGYFANDIAGGILAAPVFMTAMGVGLAYTKFNSTKQMVLRGLKLIAIHYILNIVRSSFVYFTLPHDDMLIQRVLYYTIGGDILVFAGLAMILFALLKRIKKHSNLIILIIGVVFSVLSTVFRIIECDSPLLGYTLGLLIPVNAQCDGEILVCFQLCSWFIYVAVGNMLGVTLKKVKNLNRFYLILGLIGAALATVTLLLDYNLGWQQYYITTYDVDREYITGIVYATAALGVIMFEFMVFHFLTKITPNFLNKWVFTLSSLINEIYIVSWVLILNVSYQILKAIFGKTTDLLWPLIVAFVLVLALSIVIAYYWRKLKRYIVNKRQQKLENNAQKTDRF